MTQVAETFVQLLQVITVKTRLLEDIVFEVLSEVTRVEIVAYILDESIHAARI
jgi:hypothetical protein